tara:strand:- start:1735 stop:2712 length:978 start_codon:yes stop_codon:yes gene_type:complete
MKNYISTLVIAKTFIAVFTLYFFAIYLGWDMFTYPDFYAVYNKCFSDGYSNIFYGEFFCKLNYITGNDFSHRSSIFIFIAMVINMMLLIGYFKIFERYLNEYGKYLFITLVVFHPYMNIYFFRFYTDLFACIGIFLMFYYIINNKKVDTFFILSALILMNFRIALIPVFFIYSLLEIYKRLTVNDSVLRAIILLIFSISSLLPVIEFSMKFAQINSDLGLLYKIASNTIFTFGFREALSNSGVFIAGNQTLDYLSLVIQICLLLIHFIGLYGLIKFSISEKTLILILFTYILVPISAIGHMRYLLPLMPVLIFGFAYLFFRNDKP